MKFNKDGSLSKVTDVEAKELIRAQGLYDQAVDLLNKPKCGLARPKSLLYEALGLGLGAAGELLLALVSRKKIDCCDDELKWIVAASIYTTKPSFLVFKKWVAKKIEKRKFREAEELITCFPADSEQKAILRGLLIQKKGDILGAYAHLACFGDLDKPETVSSINHLIEQLPPGYANQLH